MRTNAELEAQRTLPTAPHLAAGRLEGFAARLELREALEKKTGK